MIVCAESDAKIEVGQSQEGQLRLVFVGPQKGVSFFCYLLINPTMLSDDLGSCTFEQFVAAVFYVGKGNGWRPLHHFLDASKSRITSRKLPNKVKAHALDNRCTRVGWILTLLG